MVFGGFGSDTDDGSHKKLKSVVQMDQSGIVTATDDVTFEAVSPVTLNFTNGAVLDGVHFRCAKLLLGHPWTDLDETLGMYRVDPETMHRHIFDFRSNLKPEVSCFS